MSGIRFAGNVRIAQVDKNGVWAGGFIGVVNTQKLELVIPAPDEVTQISAQIGSLGQIISEALIPKPTSLNIQIDDLDDQRMLAFAFNGTAVAYSQTAGTITDEVVAAGALGDWVKLANRSVSAVVVKDSASAITYTAGTDYIVDAVPGFIRILPGGIITASESLKVSYTAAALTGSTVQGSNVSSTRLRVEGQLQNLVDGSTQYFVAPIYQALANGNSDLFGKNMLLASMAGKMFLPPLGTAAHTETGGSAYILTSLAA